MMTGRLNGVGEKLKRCNLFLPLSIVFVTFNVPIIILAGKQMMDCYVYLSFACVVVYDI